MLVKAINQYNPVKTYNYILLIVSEPEIDERLVGLFLVLLQFN